MLQCWILVPYSLLTASQTFWANMLVYQSGTKWLLFYGILISAWNSSWFFQWFYAWTEVFKIVFGFGCGVCFLSAESSLVWLELVVKWGIIDDANLVTLLMQTLHVGGREMPVLSLLMQLQACICFWGSEHSILEKPSVFNTERMVRYGLSYNSHVIPWAACWE